MSQMGHLPHYCYSAIKIRNKSLPAGFLTSSIVMFRRVELCRKRGHGTFMAKSGNATLGWADACNREIHGDV